MRDLRSVGNTGSATSLHRIASGLTSVHRRKAPGAVCEGDLDAFSRSLNHPKRKKAKTEPENLTWAGSGWNECVHKQHPLQRLRQPLSKLNIMTLCVYLCSAASNVLSDASNTGRSHHTPAKAVIKAEAPLASPANISAESSTFKHRKQVHVALHQCIHAACLQQHAVTSSCMLHSEL